MRTSVLAACIAVAGCVATIQPLRAQAGCDRECLRGMITGYLDAMVAHEPDSLPLAAKVRFTVDGADQKLGDGLWKTITGVRPYRWDILDVKQGVAGAHVVVEDGGAPALFVVRLKVADRKISEIETLVVHNQTEGMIYQVDALKTPSSAMTKLPERARLMSREDAIKAALHYPEGLKTGSFVKVDAPFADGTYRLENGQLMAGPGCTFFKGCDNIKTQGIPTLSELTASVAAVDEESGIVWLRMNFGKGSLIGRDGTLMVFEAFKTYGGQIHAVEAFMKAMPVGTKSGWE